MFDCLGKLGCLEIGLGYHLLEWTKYLFGCRRNISQL